MNTTMCTHAGAEVGQRCGVCGKRKPAPKPRRRHGLGKDGVDALLALQGGVCAICGVVYEDKPGKRLAMDHDHAHHPGPVGCPECVRGLLCNADNNLLRLSGESIPRLEAAIAYLRRFQQ